MYDVELSSEAQRFYDRCDRAIAKKLARCFKSLECDPRRGNNVKPLRGALSGCYRYRVATCAWSTP